MADPIINFINSPIGWITVAGVGLMLGMFLYSFISGRRAKGFEATDVEELITDTLDESLKKHGDYSSIPVRRGLRTIGTAFVFEKIYREEEVEKEDEDGETYTEEEKRKHYMVVVRPSGFLSSLSWKIMRNFGFGQRMEDIYILPENGVRLTDAVEFNEDIDLTKFAGIWISKDHMSYEVVEEIVLTELIKDNLERDTNWIKHMNWKEREHSRKLQTMEKENELKRNYFSQRTESAVSRE